MQKQWKWEKKNKQNMIHKELIGLLVIVVWLSTKKVSFKEYGWNSKMKV